MMMLKDSTGSMMMTGTLHRATGVADDLLKSYFQTRESWSKLKRIKAECFVYAGGPKATFEDMVKIYIR